MKPFWKKHPWLAILACMFLFVPMVIERLFPYFVEACEDWCREMGDLVYHLRKERRS